MSPRCRVRLRARQDSPSHETVELTRCTPFCSSSDVGLGRSVLGQPGAHFWEVFTGLHVAAPAIDCRKRFLWTRSRREAHRLTLFPPVDSEARIPRPVGGIAMQVCDMYRRARRIVLVDEHMVARFSAQIEPITHAVTIRR